MDYNTEIKKMDEEDKIMEMNAKTYIADFANEIKKIDKSVIGNYIQPTKIKKPFKVKIKQFFNKLKNTLG